MTRGSHRKDLPTSGQAAWINDACPVETWEYWESEKRFGTAFSPPLRTEIRFVLADFQSYSAAYKQRAASSEHARLDAKQIKRNLKAVIKSGDYQSAEIQDFIEIHSTELLHATVGERAAYILKEFTAAPDDFLMDRPMPKQVYTRALYKILTDHGINVSLGSAGTLYGKGGMSPETRAKAAPETPFVEFVRRCVWQVDHSSARFCGRIQGLIKTCDA